ncbi:hypothetical protein RclHR1_24630002 [Rhizophagus clarus]|uniref:Uncharacterized protein n=1 Tax=Rhizophagus clarus TaxID=94130 RepID=A0A2Z6RSJ4_9GLOM|nr:hypothetical protein RclHR1_24630002 [Rhizophagus clarus]GES93109.1 hypothetical protein GLOIN_2v1774716 [Rhizophagus clarus]
MSRAELPDLISLIKDTVETCEAYHACLTTNEYGSTYLDPIKCKARNFDPITATKEQKERILLFAERYEKIAEEKGHHAAREEAFAAHDFYNALPKQFLNNDKLDPEVPTLGEAESLNVMHKAVPGSIEKRSEPTHSSVNEAFKLIGHKIKLYDVDVEVISVKATKDGVFLEVEENVEGELIRYEIDYENDVVPL